MGCERVGTTMEEEVSKDGEGEGVRESGIRPETRGFRGSRKGLRRSIDCKTWDGSQVTRDGSYTYMLERNRFSPMSLSRINIKNYTKHEKRIARLDHF